MTGSFDERPPPEMSFIGTQTSQPWRVLSLDGGGMKGLAELLVLERLFESIRHKQKLPPDVHLKPCKYFDLIGGTSTGGLVALILGRLHMSVPEAIKYFKALSGEIFKGRKSGRLAKAWKAETGTPYFDGENMTTAIKNLLSRDLKEDQNLSLLDSDSTACKVFVTTTRQRTARLLLRSYWIEAATERNYRCTLWQAARATSAAPLYFAPFRLQCAGQTDLVLVDGALNLNNPIYEVMNEINRLDSHRNIGCVVSVGTGRREYSTIGTRGHDVIQSCIQIALDCHAKAEEYVKGSQGYQLDQAGRYFRFDPDKGMDAIQLEDWTRLDDVEEFVEMYLDLHDVGKKIDACADALLCLTPSHERAQPPFDTQVVASNDSQFGFHESHAILHLQWQPGRRDVLSPDDTASNNPHISGAMIQADKYNIDNLIRYAHQKAGGGNAQEASEYFKEARSLLEQQSHRVGLDKALYGISSEERKDRHLKSARHYIGEASAIQNQDDFDRCRIRLYRLLHEITTLQIKNGTENISTDVKGIICGHLRNCNTRLMDFNQPGYEMLCKIYQNQITRKLERLEAATNTVNETGDDEASAVERNAFSTSQGRTFHIDDQVAG